MLYDEDFALGKNQNRPTFINSFYFQDMSSILNGFLIDFLYLFGVYQFWQVIQDSKFHGEHKDKCLNHSKYSFKKY